MLAEGWKVRFLLLNMSRPNTLGLGSSSGIGSTMSAGKVPCCATLASASTSVGLCTVAGSMVRDWKPDAFGLAIVEEELFNCSAVRLTLCN